MASSMTHFEEPGHEALPVYELRLGGSWRPAGDGRTYAAVNPFTDQAWAYAPEATSADVDTAVAAARTALHGPWGEMTGAERARHLRSLATVLEEEAEHLAAIETRGNGKLLRETMAQAASLPGYYQYFAGLADKLEGTTIPADKPGYFMYTRREPVGVVAAIMAWNSPLLLLTWKLAPALAAGCTVVAKPSAYTPVSTLEFARCVERAGLPDGVFNVVTGSGADVGQQLVKHPDVDKVTFTGSTQTGIAVGKAAMENVTRVSLELGGKSAQVVFADAELEAAAIGVVSGIFAATGQTCVAGSRLVVEQSAHDEIVARLVHHAEKIRLGDPVDPASEMGPLANKPQLAKVSALVQRAVEQGAHVAAGGRVSRELGGLFFEPTILTGVRPDMEIAREEVFGPVLAVMRFDDEDEAVALANDTRFGLAAGLWTENVRRAHRVAHRLEAGTVWINAYRMVAPNAPFGGVKLSGIGRENGRDAVQEYLETKTIWLALNEAEGRDPFSIG
ncbi:MAG: aldehyde dehydrogenase family protein [Solirubrobacterales bacterium]|nr:aldehyde dehydrogenase family protein [Solirubrobacterales bacterium]